MSGGCGGGCGSRRSSSFMNDSDRSPSRYISNSVSPNTLFYEHRQTTSIRRIGVRLPTPEEERMVLAATSPRSNSRYLMNSSSSSSSPQEYSYSKQYLEPGPSVSQRSLSRSLSPRLSVSARFSPSRQSTMIDDESDVQDPFAGSYQAASFGSSRRSGCGC